jgi:hypothetical protein
MAQPDPSDPRWQLGLLGEAISANVFKSCGAYVIPLKDITNGSAPMMATHGQRIVLPDFDVALEGETFYVDSKCKTSPVLYRLKRQFRHGIDLKNYVAYRQAGDTYRKRVGLLLLELYTDESHTEWSGSLLAGRLDKLGEPIAGASSQRHMVYWPRSAFHQLGSLTRDQVRRLQAGIIDQECDFTDSILATFLPRKQTTLF